MEAETTVEKETVAIEKRAGRKRSERDKDVKPFV